MKWHSRHIQKPRSFADRKLQALKYWKCDIVMSRRFFSADFHLGSTNILRYANRPWQTAEIAVDAIIDMVNEKCDKSDVLIHAGDFVLSGKDNHDKIVDVGLDIKENDYLRRIKTNVFLLNGNHDEGHNGNSFANNLWLDLNHNWRNVYVSHYPSYHQFYRGPDRGTLCEWDPAVVLCGHVHDVWLLKYDKEKHVLNINVGIDVWNCKVVEDVQLTLLLDFLKVHLWRTMIGLHSFQMNRHEFDIWKREKQQMVEKSRVQRRQEKHEKKGLTPEICEQRRIAAMKSKGLI